MPECVSILFIMNPVELLRIDPAKKDEYVAIVDKAFRQWYEQKWSFLPYEEFQTLSSASFLAYVRHLLTLADEEGIIELGKARESLRSVMGEYFREEKLGNTIIFYQDDGWKNL